MSIIIIGEIGVDEDGWKKNEEPEQMDPTYTVAELSHILKLSLHSLKDPRFRQRIGLRAVHIGKRSIRFRESDVLKILNPERVVGEGEGSK